MIKCTDCYSKGPKFHSQHVHRSSQIPVAPFQGLRYLDMYLYESLIHNEKLQLKMYLPTNIHHKKFHVIMNQ